MAQHDYVIANGTGAAVRSDLNNALAAIVSQNSGAVAPTTTYAYMPWADTTTGLFKIRNAANNGWITLYQLDGEWSTIALENGSAAAPSIYFKDSGTDTGIYSPGTDQVAISTGGTGRLFVDSSGRVGLGTSSPQVLNHLSTSTDTQLRIESTSASSTNEAAVQLIRGSNQSAIKNKAGGLEFFVQGLTNEIARFDSSGRLGIGTTSPAQLLDIASSATAYAQLRGGGGANQGSAYLIRDSANAAALAGFGDTAALTGGAADASVTLFSKNNTPIIFYSSTERGRWDAQGRFLVGTSSPVTSGKLSVNGGSIGISNSGFATVEFGRGISGSFSTIRIVVDITVQPASVIFETLMSGFNQVYLDSVIGMYGGIAPITMRNNASSGTSAALSLSGNTYTLTITTGITHPVVKVKISGGGLASAISEPTFTFA